MDPNISNQTNTPYGDPNIASGSMTISTPSSREVLDKIPSNLRVLANTLNAEGLFNLYMQAGSPYGELSTKSVKRWLDEFVDATFPIVGTRVAERSRSSGSGSGSGSGGTHA